MLLAPASVPSNVTNEPVKFVIPAGERTVAPLYICAPDVVTAAPISDVKDTDKLAAPAVAPFPIAAFKSKAPVISIAPRSKLPTPTAALNTVFPATNVKF